MIKLNMLINLQKLLLVVEYKDMDILNAYQVIIPGKGEDVLIVMVE